ncbi:hypothetical protein [Dongia sp.]|uniref:hypothetical protein n=1 Tax=Dongia sp. TaxID=1977262 RepID=UPI0037507FE0
MYNSNLPRRADLPTAAQLQRSSSIAASIAGIILAFIVLPAEYALDPTGIGRLLGLTQMGEIKMQLAAEAAMDASKSQQVAQAAAVPPPAAPIQPAPAPVPAPAPAQQAEAPTQPAAAPAIPNAPAQQAATAAAGRTDEVSFTLTPGEGLEVKLVMREGAKAAYAWSATDVVNYDTHGDGGGSKISYAKGRGVKSDTGVIQAAFDGNHGWFWRNRTTRDVTVTLRTNGNYEKLKNAL